MWMIDRGGNARFPLECGVLLGVGSAFLLQDLESYLAIQITVHGLVDPAHPSFAKEFQQPIVVKLPVDTQSLPTIRATKLRQWRLIGHIHQCLAERASLDHSTWVGACVNRGFLRERSFHEIAQIQFPRAMHLLSLAFLGPAEALTRTFLF